MDLRLVPRLFCATASCCCAGCGCRVGDFCAPFMPFGSAASIGSSSVEFSSDDEECDGDECELLILVDAANAAELLFATLFCSGPPTEFIVLVRRAACCC